MSAQWLICLLIALTGLADGIALAAQGMSIDWSTKLTPVIVVLVLAGASVIVRRFSRRIGRLLIAVAQIAVFTHVGALLTYAAMAASPFPTADVLFDRADAALGFDWQAWHDLINAHPAVQSMLSWAYSSIPKQLAVLLLYFCFTNQARVDEFLLSGILAIYIVVAIMIVVPATGAGVQSGVVIVEPWRSDILALRSHTLLTISATQGIVSFPSYHTVLGVLLIAMARGCKWLFYPLLALNGLLIASVMSEGTHYFVDMLGGLAVSYIAMLTSRFLLARCPREAEGSRPVHAGAPIADRDVLAAAGRQRQAR